MTPDMPDWTEVVSNTLPNAKQCVFHPHVKSHCQLRSAILMMIILVITNAI